MIKIKKTIADKACPRCGIIHHQNIELKTLYNNDTYTHWAICPVNAEPILFRKNDVVCQLEFEQLKTLEQISRGLTINGWEIRDSNILGSVGVSLTKLKISMFCSGSNHKTVCKINNIMFDDWQKPNMRVRWIEKPNMNRIEDIDTVIKMQVDSCTSTIGHSIYANKYQAYQDFIITHWAKTYIETI